MGEAVGLVVLMIAFIAAAGGVAAAGMLVGLEETPITIVTVVLLTMTYGAVLCVTWLLARASGVPFGSAVGVRRVPIATVLLGAVLATVVGRGAAALWGVLITALDIDVAGMDTDPTQLFAPGPLGIAATVLVAVVLAPIAEEVVFRGVLLSALERRWGSTTAIVASSGVFALMHVTPFAIVPIFVLALVLGNLFVRTRSLTVCIAAHAVFNGVGLALLYAAKAAGLL